MAEETNILSSNVVFILLNILFFSSMLYVAVRVSSSDAAYEQMYSKKIALILDKAEAQVTMKIDITELYLASIKNKYDLTIKAENNVVTVKIAEGKGYSYPYFSDYDIEYSLDKQSRDLILIVK